MTWKLSRFRTGDLVQIRSKEEILATLDHEGRTDGMPFMPEMLQYCGQRVRVGAVAHKTCETAHQTWKARRLETTVHLADLRCDGSAHGGCQADCRLFWKDAWLKPADPGDAEEGPDPAPAHAPAARPPGCTEAQLLASARASSPSTGDEPRYSCQTTRLFEATEPLAWWDPRQYLRDVITKNHSPGHVLRVLWFAFLKECLRLTPIGYRLLEGFRQRMHVWVTGREAPEFQGTIPAGARTPSGRLHLQPGERVRIKSKDAIVQTLDEIGRNRGLGFDVELSPFCGRVVSVRSSVTKILDELTGEMRTMKEPCIILEGVACRAEYSHCRLLCPRAIPSYWRELWLERIPEDEGAGDGPLTPDTVTRR